MFLICLFCIFLFEKKKPVNLSSHLESLDKQPLFLVKGKRGLLFRSIDGG